MFRRPRTNGGNQIRKARSAYQRRGVAAVEFAVVAPVFFLMMIGFIELGRALMVQQVLTNASRVGVREAIALHGTKSDAIAAAEAYAEGVAVSGVTVSVAPDPDSVSAGTEIVVNVSINYMDVSWVPAPWFMGESVLQAESVMRKEGFD